MGQIPTILCIDDFKAGLITRKAFLESFGFQVFIAECGSEGMEILKSKKVDAVILDYRMPLLNGEIVARQIRGFRPEIPILLLSGVSKLPHSLVEQIDRFVLKGNDPRILISELDSLTATTTAQRKRTMQNAEKRRTGQAKPLRKVA
jgi:response regulator RpfG family c-di-GMP phosphodiesterase